MPANVLLARLDARDRELFNRWTIFSDDRLWAKRFWTTLTHLGGVSCSVLAAALPLRAGGPPVEVPAHYAILRTSA